MKQKKDCRRSDCPISFTLEILGDRWTLLVLRDLIFLNKGSYGDFLNSEEKIATNILANRLKRLEVEGIVTKSKEARNRAKYIYELTEKGIDLLPLLLEAIRWGAKYDPKTAAPKEFIQRLKRDRDAVIKEISSRLVRQNKKRP